VKSEGPIPGPGKREISEGLPLSGDERAERVARFRAILASKQLTVYSLMKKTRQLYGSSSEYFIPHNFSHYIISRVVSPHICQVVALSRLTGYRLADWMEFFGFAPDMVSSWQLRLHSDQTTLLPSEVYDKNALVPFLGTPLRAEELDRTVPLSRIAKYSTALTARKVESLTSRRFLYARIGKQDALGFPDLVPESIMRIDPRRTTVETEFPAGTSRPLYLVEVPGSLTCCHVQRAGGDRILLAPHRLEFERLEFRLGREAEILGTANAEIRPVPGLRSPITTDHRKALRIVSTRPAPGPDSTLGELLRHSRERIGVNLRKIHEMSRQLALDLNDDRYQLSTSALWEMETNNVLPRHIEKILSVCILYCLDLFRYLRAARIPVDEAGQEPMPSQHRSTKSSPVFSSHDHASPNLTLAGHLAQLIEEIPLFLRHGFPFQFGEQTITARELYWVGQRERIFHPLLNGALVIAVDASKTGEPSGRIEWTESWERPIYLIMRRDEKYLCGFCAFKDNVVTLVPHPDCPVEPMHFVNGQDAEILGRVTAVARLLP
jgi:hypothetical protein